VLPVFHYSSERHFRCTDFVIGHWAVDVARINNGSNLENSFVSSLILISCFPVYFKISQKVLFPLETLSVIMYTLSNKNLSARNFLSPKPEVTCCTVALIIRVVLLSHICAFVPFLCPPFIIIHHSAYILTEDDNTFV